jgi:non-heme chloroperoxidase
MSGEGFPGIPPGAAPEPHALFVEANGVRLHGLLWGEHGEPLLLLPGLGQSAHVFRELAPALEADHAVIALTPRGHGESATPPDGYTVAQLAADAAEVLRRMGVHRAAVAAHSVGSAVATCLALRHPDVISHVVYLDGVSDYAGRDAVVARNPVPPPPRPLFGPLALQRAWMRRYQPGFWGPALEADLAARRPLEEEVRRLTFLHALLDDAGAHPPKYVALRQPALALVAAESVASQYPWLAADDADARARAEAYLREVRGPWRRAAVDRFRREAPHARVVEVPGGHWFFLSARDRVADEIRAFLLTPAPDDP